MSLGGDLGCKSSAVRWMSRDTERAGDASFSSRSFVYWFLPLIRLCWLFAVLLCELLIEAAVGGGVPGALTMVGVASEADGGSLSFGAADLVGAKDISSEISESDDKLAYADAYLCHNCPTFSTASFSAIVSFVRSLLPLAFSFVLFRLLLS